MNKKSIKAALEELAVKLSHIGYLPVMNDTVEFSYRKEIEGMTHTVRIIDKDWVHFILRTAEGEHISHMSVNLEAKDFIHAQLR